jgi:hypothetical protein
MTRSRGGGGGGGGRLLPTGEASWVLLGVTAEASWTLLEEGSDFSSRSCFFSFFSFFSESLELELLPKRASAVEAEKNRLAASAAHSRFLRSDTVQLLRVSPEAN